MTNDKQTAEEAARYFEAMKILEDIKLHHPLSKRNAPLIPTHVLKNISDYVAKLESEREKVLGERWVIVGEGCEPQQEEDAWRDFLFILDYHAPLEYQIEQAKARGYRAVKVKLVEVPE
jgi:hypothetical protein